MFGYYSGENFVVSFNPEELLMMEQNILTAELVKGAILYENYRAKNERRQKMQKLSALSDEIFGEIKSLMENGQKIAAIKFLRNNVIGVSLRECRDFVETL